VGRRGPAPRPAAENEARGNPGHRKKRPPSVQPTALESLAPPAWLHKLAKEEWRRLAPELARLGRLTVADSTAFAGYCSAFATWRQALAARQGRGMTLAMAIAQGLVNAEKAALAQMERLGAQFGLTPASRDRMPGAPTEPEKDEFAEFEEKKGPQGIVGGRA
jgi:P27 family predicted phage terminase small subunit